jgi:hypothetical protein
VLSEKRVIAERFDTAPDASSANFMKNSERNERNQRRSKLRLF